MPQNMQRVKEFIEAHPETRKVGTVQHEVAHASHELAVRKGYEVGDPNYMALVERELASIESPAAELTAEEIKTAADIGMDLELYAQGVQERERRKRENYYGA